MSDVQGSQATSPSGQRARSGEVRRFVRIACLLGAAAALWPMLPRSNAALYVTALSPFVATASLLALREISLAVAAGIGIGLAALFRHRLFCRWLCPMGVCTDAASWMGRHLGRRSRPWPHVGQWVALATLGGALLGYPLLLWLDPLAIFAGLFDAIQGRQHLLGWTSAWTFFGVMALSVVWPGVWCGRICPLGGLQDLLVRSRRFLGAMRRRKAETADPHVAGSPLARRTFLGVTGGAIAAKAAALHKAGGPLRPPGARAEAQFVGLCSRCGNCIRACPSGIIQRDPGKNGLAGLLAPTLSFEQDYCRQDCVRCTQVCPSGALTPVPLEGKPGVRIGRPEVDMSVCLLGDDRECAACARWCPYGAIRYVFSEQDYTLRPKIDPARCNGCGACEVACPTKPRKAIVVRPVG